MTDQNEQMIENAIRLLDKAKLAERPLAADYLAPLALLAEQVQGPEAARAAAEIHILISELRDTGRDPADAWHRCFQALHAWKASL